MITFILGNGFDLQMGLLTQFKNFYEVYTKKKDGDNDNIKRFKEEILKDKDKQWETWGDFELQMGEHTKYFKKGNPSDDFFECLEDFYTQFDDYLIGECKKVDWENENELAKCLEVFRRSILNFYLYVRSVETKQISYLIKEDDVVNFLQLNYTNIFDSLLEKSTIEHRSKVGNNRQPRIKGYEENLHIHGTFDGGHMIMGLDNIEQLANKEMRSDPKISRVFVKPTRLEVLQNRDVNTKIPKTLGIDVINSSTAICIFGSSIGETDRSWWKIIGGWLLNGKGKLIIFDRCFSEEHKNEGSSLTAFNSLEEKREAKRLEILFRFQEFSGIEGSWFIENQGRVIVELDTEMFGFELPMISEE